MHKINILYSKSNRWPEKAYFFNSQTGIRLSPLLHAQMTDNSYYLKTHELGYRIDKLEDALSYRSGGILSLGCSFTFGDEVEASETYSHILADSMGAQSYNYGVCSFNYPAALLLLKKLSENHILDSLNPSMIVLGCWEGLHTRSYQSFFPMAENLILPCPSFINNKEGKIEIKCNLNKNYVFNLKDYYASRRNQNLDIKTYFKLFPYATEYWIQKIKNTKDKKIEVNDEMVYSMYDFILNEMQQQIDTSKTKIVLLWMPHQLRLQPHPALVELCINKYKDIILIDGYSAVKKYRVPELDYMRRHPQKSSHLAYANEIWEKVKNDYKESPN
ncbi:MAG: hypothetical protein PHT69_00665 [Bacteroidales bacterium]|nr:hypothetical protein [Bacteroidales bacterium]